MALYVGDLNGAKVVGPALFSLCPSFFSFRQGGTESSAVPHRAMQCPPLVACKPSKAPLQKHGQDKTGGAGGETLRLTSERLYHVLRPISLIEYIHRITHVCNQKFGSVSLIRVVGRERARFAAVLPSDSNVHSFAGGRAPLCAREPFVLLGPA